MSYFDYRARYREGDRDALLERFAEIRMPYALAQSYMVGRAKCSGIVTMDDLLTVHRLCVTENISPKALLCSGFPLFKKEDDLGCKAEDAQGLTADFVQEVNAFGRNNPMFYAAYLINGFCHISPFETENIAVACALCNGYLVSRDMPPIVFSAETMESLGDVIRRSCETEDLKELKNMVSSAAEATFSQLFTEL